jgi:hypothetical protein
MGKVAISMTTGLEDPEKVTRSSDHRTGEGEHALTTKEKSAAVDSQSGQRAAVEAGECIPAVCAAGR